MALRKLPPKYDNSKFLFFDDFVGAGYEASHWSSATTGGSVAINPTPTANGALRVIAYGTMDTTVTMGTMFFASPSDSTFRASVKIPVLTGGLYTEIGLQNTTNYACLAIDTGVTSNWMVQARNASGNTTTATSVPVATDAWTELQVDCLASSVVYRVNGAIVGTATTNLPTLTLSPYFYWEALTTDKTLLIDWVEVTGGRA